MSKNLVIVESPAKAKTIAKFLGDDYKVMSSYGHIRDLHKKDFSIDIAAGYSPIYEIPAEKKELVAGLKREAKKADMVWLASDEDREGEAIAWHLYEVLGLDPAKTRRIVFHEITKSAILNAIENPRDIDINLVDAQQARRVLDRIVGFELSPVLWKKIKPALSAGRVQSVAVRLIVEREKEIAAFKSEQYYRVVAQMQPDGTDAKVNAELSQRLPDEAAARQFVTAGTSARFRLADNPRTPWTRRPAPPDPTSPLQPEAARQRGFTVAQTMMVAQKLYESGFITYMRTDSLNLSSLAIGTISKEIKENIGEEYLKIRKYHTSSKGAQEAHEAIRPTNIAMHDIAGGVQEKKLYALIWKRTIASQMADALMERTNVDISISNRAEKFTATGEVVKFDGFLKVYMESTDDDNSAAETRQSEGLLPAMTTGMGMKALEVTATQRFTQQPPRYTEASLVKKLEELGIGRPSTYAPTISTIQNREYVAKGEKKGEPRSFKIITLKGTKITEKTGSETAGMDKGKLIPTDTGVIVNDFLQQYFPSIMDYNFTARIEEEFDEVAEGKMKWSESIDKFYTRFHPNVTEVSNLRLEHKVGERILGTDPKTGRQVSVKIGRFGPLVQIGSTDDSEKPQFASLLKGQSVSSITLDEALKLFEMPRTLGEFEGDTVTVAIGRFGPYVKHGSKFVSIPKELAPQTITLDEAIELIRSKREEDAKKVVKTFADDPDMQVLNGKYGVYIAYHKKNFKIPKGTDAEALTLEDCLKIVADEANAPKKTTRSRRTAKK